MAMSTPGGLAQVVATLIDNALVHGAGTVTVHTRETSVTSCSRFATKGRACPTTSCRTSSSDRLAAPIAPDSGSRSHETS